MGSVYLVLLAYPKIPLLKRLSKMKGAMFIFNSCPKTTGLFFHRNGYGETVITLIIITMIEVKKIKNYGKKLVLVMACPELNL